MKTIKAQTFTETRQNKKLLTELKDLLKWQKKIIKIILF